MSQGSCARFILGSPFLVVCINVTEYGSVEEKAQIHRYLQCFRRIRSRQSRVGAYAIGVEVGFGVYYICIVVYIYVYIYGLWAIHPTFRSLSQQVHIGVFVSHYGLYIPLECFVHLLQSFFYKESDGTPFATVLVKGS